MKRLVLFLSLFSSFSYAVIKDGVEYKDTIVHDGQTLVLNGLGYRLATIFKIKAYLSGLYLIEKSSDAEKIINSKELKIIRMTFNRDIEKSKFIDGLKVGFKKNEIDLKAYAKELDKIATELPNLKEKDEIMVYLTAKGVEFILNEKKITIEGADFSHDLLKLWLKNPPNEEIKIGMLGL